jgi:hypothetical protein
MRVVSRRGVILAWGLLAPLAVGAGLVRQALRTALVAAYEGDPAIPAPAAELAPGWRVVPLRELPEEVATVTAPREGHSGLEGHLFVGTSGSGMILRIQPAVPRGMMRLAAGMGDLIEHGDCAVNRVVVGDLDGDGTAETVATTSQIQPTGRPRLYAWEGTTLAGLARPDIGSSWSHGLAVVPGAAGAPARLFVTYCGRGEVVEFRLPRPGAAGGFRDDAPAWAQVAALPASGEQVEAADADNDGRIDLVLACGFAVGGAGLRLFTPGEAPGAPLVPGRVIDEAGRYGNVRFLVGDLAGDGGRELIAWWCTDLAGGDCDVIRYRLTPEGVARREVLARGPASELWPDDNQAALGDADGDGAAEVWFATHAGRLWRYDPAARSGPDLVATFPGGLGPLAVAGPTSLQPRAGLVLGQGRLLFRLEAIPARS